MPIGFVHAHHHGMPYSILFDSPLVGDDTHEESQELGQHPLQFILVPTIFEEHSSL